MVGTKTANYTSLQASIAATHERVSFMPIPGEAARQDGHLAVPVRIFYLFDGLIVSHIDKAQTYGTVQAP